MSGRTPTHSTPFDPVAAVCARHFPQLPLDVPRILLAAWLANHEAFGFDDPCWLAAIAPASSLKTVLLTALSDATDGYVLDTLTPQTFISGLLAEDGRSHARAGLLHRLGARPNIFVKDLSGILTKRSWDRDEIMGQLRGIYDGEYSRPTGTGATDDVARWKGRMSLIVGVTPAIDIYHALNNQLGERFVQLRFAIAEEDVTAVSAQALANVQRGVDGRGQLAMAFRLAIKLARPHLSPAVLTPDAQCRLNNLVAFAVKARAGVVRHEGVVVQEPAPEGPGRLTKQLAALGCGLAAIRGAATLSAPDYSLVERVAFNSIPDLRGKVLWALYDQGARSIADFQRAVRVTEPTIRSHLEDLVLVGLAVADGTGRGVERHWRPSPLGQKYLDAARGEQST